MAVPWPKTLLRQLVSSVQCPVTNANGSMSKDSTLSTSVGDPMAGDSTLSTCVGGPMAGDSVPQPMPVVQCLEFSLWQLVQVIWW